MLAGECKYIINKKNVSLNLMKLTEYYYKQNYQMRDTFVFSSDEILDSTVREIKKQLERKNEIINDSSKTDVLKYIGSSNNKTTYNELGILNDQLAPEYNKENRILNTVINRLNQEGLFPNKNDSIDAIRKKFPEAEKHYQDVLEDIKVEENTKNLSFGIHSILNQVISNDGEFNTKIEKNLKKVVEDNKEYLGGDLDEWTIKFIEVIETIYSRLKTLNGRILTEVNLASEPNAPAQVHGKLDIVVIDESGRAHIFDLKLSRDSYAEWNSAKMLTTDWQLAFYRALLGQYIDIKDASLNIIPIKVGGIDENDKININNLLLEQTKNRLSEETGYGLLTTGKLYNTARKLIPEKTKLNRDTKRVDNIVTDLKVLFPEYYIKTEAKEYDEETLLDKVIQQNGLQVEYEDFKHEKLRNNRVSLSKKVGDRFKTEKELREEYRPIVKEYISFAKETKNRNVIQLREKIVQAITNKGATIELLSKQDQVILNAIVANYINGDYKVIGDSEELTSLGLILLQNTRYGSYVLLNISAHNQNASYNNDLLYSDLDFIKGMMFFNHAKDELELDINKIEDIVTFNLQGKQVPPKDLDEKYRLFSNEVGKNKLLINNLKESNIIELDKRAVIDLKNAQRNAFDRLTGTDKEALKEVLDGYTEDFNDISLHKLKQLSKRFTSKFSQLAGKGYKDGFDYDNKIEALFGYLQILILIKSGQVPVGDFMGLVDFNIQFSSFKDLFAGLFSNKIDTFDKKNRRIGTIIEGLKTITPDKVGSKDLQNINIMISETNSFVRQAFNKESTKIGGWTRKLYKAINYGKFQQNWVGNHRTAFENMWLKDLGTNEVSFEWRTKNPYSNDSKDLLSDGEKEYLKNILFEINKYKLSKEEFKSLGNVDVSSLESIKRTAPKAYAKIQQLIDDGEYFRMPLVRSQQFNRNLRFNEDATKGMIDAVRLKADEMRDFFDKRELSSEEVIASKGKLGFYEMYDQYAHQSDKFKTEQLAKNGVLYYELDLDAVANRFVFNKIRKKHVDEILPIINAYAWYMKMQAGKQDEDISKELEYIVERIKTGALNEPILEEEFEDIVKATSVVRKITTAGMLALRPATFVKEMTIGVYKAVTIAGTKIYGENQFGMKSLMAAFGKLAAVDKKFAPEWNMIDAINNDYGFANRDLNTLNQKMQTNRRGILMGLNPWMYSMNTLPDYYNRLAMFIAQMIEDGSYDAHSIDEDGYLLYDPSKDKRFSHYFTVRNNYINPDTTSIENTGTKYLPSKTDTLYNKQRALYEVVKQQMNVERRRAGIDELTSDEDIDKAYSQKERQSFKSFTDTVYGYYDYEAQAALHQKWYGFMLFQFMQFWPGKMSMWFGSKKDPKISPSGHFKQVTQDVEGKKVLMWREAKFDEDGKFLGFEHTTQDTGDPLLEWIGTDQQGLFAAMMLTAKDIVTMNWTNIKNEDLRTRRALFGLADGVLMIIIFGILAKLFQAIISEKGTDSIDGKALNYMAGINKRVLSEANVWGNTFGALRSQPAFWTYGLKVAGDIIDVTQGDKDMVQTLAKDFKMFEFLQE